MNIVPLRTTGNIIARRMLIASCNDNVVTAEMTIDGVINIEITARFDLMRGGANIVITIPQPVYAYNTGDDIMYFQCHISSFVRSMEDAFCVAVDTARIHEARSRLYERFFRVLRWMTYEQQDQWDNHLRIVSFQTGMTRYYREMDWHTIDFWNQWLDENTPIRGELR